MKVFTQERKLFGARYGTLLLTDVCLVGARDRLTYGMFHETRLEHFLRALTHQGSVGQVLKDLSWVEQEGTRMGGGAGRRHVEAKHPCGLSINNKFELRRLLNRQIGRVSALKNSRDDG